MMSNAPLLTLALGLGLSLGLWSPGHASAAALSCDDDSGLCIDSGDATFAPGELATPKERNKRSKKTPGSLSVELDDGRGSVFINGRFVGTAPVSDIEVPSGKNDIQVRDGSSVLASGVIIIPKNSDVSVTVRYE